MARHGYLREYDEEFERGDERERGWSELDRDWRDRDRERGLLFGDPHRDRFSDEDRWTTSDRGMSRYGREHGYGDYREGRRSLSADPDEHYRNWRDKQMRALDREYEDYCREREQQFHQDFDSWRRNRQSSQAVDVDTSEELLLDRNIEGTTIGAQQEPQAPVDSESAATLGTSPTGRGSR